MHILRNKCLPAALLALFIWQVSLPAAAEPEWKKKKSKHFVVHYPDSESRLAGKVAQEAEEHYTRITTDLGFVKYGDYWTWENRADIFIYRTRKEFAEYTGAPEWAAGKADYGNKNISTYRDSGGFLDKTLPHELTHLVFREFVKDSKKVPLWLDEGVAEWEEKKDSDEYREIMKDLVRNDGIMTLDQLGAMDVRKTKDVKLVAGFYAQSASLVGFIIGDYGSAGFRKFCGYLRDGRDFAEALRFTYPVELRNMEQLEAAWRNHLQETFSRSSDKKGQ